MVPSTVSVPSNGGGGWSPSSADVGSPSGGGWSEESEGVDPDPDRGGGAPVEPADPGGAGGASSVFPSGTGASSVEPGKGGGEPEGLCSLGNDGSGGISGFREVMESRSGGLESSEPMPGDSSEPGIGGGGPVAEKSITFQFTSRAESKS